jgi:hypothetical protein
MYVINLLLTSEFSNFYVKNKGVTYQYETIFQWDVGLWL